MRLSKPLWLDKLLSLTKGTYSYNCVSPVIDTIGDTRYSNQSGVQTFEYCTAGSGAKGAGTWAAYLSISITGDIKFPNLQTFADEAAASALTSGTVYKTATGELRIKL